MVDTILLVPTYNRADMLPTFFSYLYRLKPQPSKTVFAENNSKDETVQKVMEFRRAKELIRVWFRDDVVMTADNRYEVIAHIRQLLLTRARQLDPDYAIFLDDDVFVLDKDMIEKLTSHRLDVVGGPYLRCFPWGIFLASIWKDPDGKLRSWDTPPSPLEEVELQSAGVMCLSRKVIQDRRANFYPIISKTSSEDFNYCRQLKTLGYKIWLDGTVKLKHFIKRSGRRMKPWTYNEKTKKYLPFYFS